MKKLITAALVLALLAASTVVSAAEFEFSVSYENYEFYKRMPIPVADSSPYENDPWVNVYEINGKAYTGSYTNRYVPFDISAYAAIMSKTDTSVASCIRGDNNYLALDPSYIGAPPNVMSIIPAQPLYVFDNGGNLIKEVKFEGDGLVVAIDYYNGAYYCNYKQKCLMTIDENGDFVPGDPVSGGSGGRRTMHRNVFVVSTDLETWTEIDEMPKHNDDVIWKDGQVAFANHDYAKVSYESAVPQYFGNFGEWFAFMSGEDTLCLSNDNVYFSKIHLPSSDESGGYAQLSMNGIYEADGNIVISTYYSDGTQFIAPAQPIYEELNRLKNAPYIKLNGTILAFDSAPVIDSDRTLVPMRFLFEQMGANVEWDGQAQTATAKQQGKVVSFGINSLSANVDGQTVQMDVAPQLIGDKTFVPLRFLSENLGYRVEWDAETNTAIITTDQHRTDSTSLFQKKKAGNAGIALSFLRKGLF